MTDFINPSEHSKNSISELVTELTGGLGVDYCFECTGVGALVNETVESIKPEIDNMDELLTHEVQLEDISSVFEVLKKPDC
ncbi:CYP enzymes assisting alcohol dehydrogenase [Camellia lanceoleosa]|uniref:CYP enzymes assisting alcohol dehydrogenase n=1 Tax=Camellia lanceoleosa TaxID=1840588 RepID=A0ACC0H6N7_9ERIC|nr:CYP enzymes assisting alcohol dehydrogenase [Camellia lanceoleosa]